MKNKEKKLTIKQSILLSMSIIIIIMLAILWITETLLLPHIYQQTKLRSVKKVASNISDNIDNDDLDSLMSEVAYKYETCIRVYKCSNKEMLFDKHYINECFIHKVIMTDQVYNTWYENAESKNGYYSEILDMDSLLDYDYNADDFIGNVPENSRKNAKSVLAISLATDSDGDEMMIVLNSYIYPVDSTIQALNIQLVFISVLIILIASVVSVILSRKISYPIEKISKEAKNLSNENFDFYFPEEGTVETVELAKTLNTAKDELSKVKDMQKELIANISHDLRTPLTMIRGYGEVMRDIPGENTPENVQVIIDETTRLSSLVNDLLDVSKLQSGKQSLSLSRMCITDCINDTIKRYDKLIYHNGFVIDFEYDDKVFVLADEIKMLQVLYNLINNAINYSGEKKVVTVKQVVQKDIVRIDVIDYGEGISKEDLPKIWDRYYKVDKVHKRTTVGTGVGLSIVKNILILHGARFGVSSEPGKGSDFWFEMKKSE